MPAPQKGITPEHSPAEHFPRHLAEKILQSRSALKGEHQRLTVIFADVKRSMELSGRLDPEVWHAVLDGLFNIPTEGSTASTVRRLPS